MTNEGVGLGLPAPLALLTNAQGLLGLGLLRLLGVVLVVVLLLLLLLTVLLPL